MTYIVTIFIVCFVIALIWRLYNNESRKYEHESTTPSRAQQLAFDLIRTDPRVAQVVMLLSYSDMDIPSMTGARGKSNKRLVVEVRQIAKHHFPNATIQQVNLIAAQLLMIARNIGQKRRQKNANMSVSKRK